jgi:uncharacterized glyoxalase superfamily protein PhnB
MKDIMFILYVADQAKSKVFYQEVLQIEPSLDVQGMTEFQLADSVKLGLMPENGIAKILSDKMPHPKKGNGIPRCELYLKVENAQAYIEKGLQLGGKAISALQDRDWGDKVGYISDLDGHVIAFAEKT